MTRMYNARPMVFFYKLEIPRTCIINNSFELAMSISNLLTSGAQAGADLSITCHNVICDAESVFEAGLQTDNIAEYSAGAGVSIDGVLLKDGGVKFGIGASSLNSYETITGTADIWRYTPTAYNYGELVVFSFVSIGDMRMLHFRVPASVADGGYRNLRICLAGNDPLPFLNPNNRPASSTYQMIYLKNNGTDGAGTARIDADGYIYLEPSVAWVANTTNQIFTSCITWTVNT